MKSDDIAASLPGLRRRAMELLDEGRVPDLGRYNAGEAMRVLCRLALEQGTAPDALALLHELQVHQVELDLQNEELKASQRALEDALREQTVLFEQAPVGYLMLDTLGVVRHCNQRAPALMGMTRQALQGMPLDHLLTATSREQLRHMLALAAGGVPPQTQVLELLSGGGAGRALHATATHRAVDDSFLLALMPPPAD